MREVPKEILDMMCYKDNLEMSVEQCKSYYGRTSYNFYFPHLFVPLDPETEKFNVNQVKKDLVELTPLMESAEYDLDKHGAFLLRLPLVEVDEVTDQRLSEYINECVIHSLEKNVRLEDLVKEMVCEHI